MARAIDKQTMLDLIIEAKCTDPGTGSFAEWLAEYLVERLPTLAPPNEWVSVEERLPPENIIVDTRIDDGKYKRNEQPLKRRGNLWHQPDDSMDDSMHVYYTPTHWRWPAIICDEAAAALSTLQAENAELRDKLNYVRMKRDAAVCCIFKVEGALDRGTDNKWAREHIAEWRRIEEG